MGSIRDVRPRYPYIDVTHRRRITATATLQTPDWHHLDTS